MDLPYIHDYTYRFLIKPLCENKCLNIKFIDWVPRPEDKKAEDEDDNIDFDNSDAQFKLMALILSDKQISNKDIEASFKTAAKVRKQKLEDADSTWQEIKEDLGADAEAVIKMLRD